MNYSNLNNILVELGVGMVSGMLMEILLEIFIIFLMPFFLVLFFLLATISGWGITFYWEFFAVFYLPFLLIKFGFWLLLCWGFRYASYFYFNLGFIYLIVPGVIGFYTLVYSIFEVLSTCKKLGLVQWYSLRELPPPPVYGFLLWIGVLKNSS